MTTLSRALSCAVLLLWLAPSRAHAWCHMPEGSHWARHQAVRVRIHADLQNQMQHQDGTRWTRSELEASVQWTLSRVNDSGRGDIPWLYLDTETPASSCTWLDADCNVDPVEDPLTTCGAADTIHIVPSNCSQMLFAWAGTRQVIVVQTSDAAIALPEHALYGHHLDTNDTWALEPRLLHELGHALGLDHPMVCAGWSTICPTNAMGCAAMAAEDTPATEIFTVDDANGLEAMWGRRDAPVIRQWERALPEASFSTLTPTTTLGATSYFSASSSPLAFADTTRATIVGYHPTADIPVVWSWSWINQRMTPLRSPNLHRTTGPLGVAQSRTQRFVTSLTPRLSDDQRRWRRRVTVSARDLRGRSMWRTTQSDPLVESPADTDVAGISTTRDPMSGFLVHAFRERYGRVVLQGSDGASSFSNVIETNIHSMSTPRVACAGSGTALNCILTVVDPGSPWSEATSQRLQWLDFSWSQEGATASWEPGLLYTTRFTPQGEHSLAVARNPDGTFQYDIAYTGRGGDDSTLLYVIRRQLPSTSFVAMGFLREEHGAQPHVAFGGVGTAFELFSFSRHRTR